MVAEQEALTGVATAHADDITKVPAPDRRELRADAPLSMIRRLGLPRTRSE